MRESGRGGKYREAAGRRVYAEIVEQDVTERVQPTRVVDRNASTRDRNAWLRPFFGLALWPRPGLCGVRATTSFDRHHIHRSQCS